MTVRFQIIEHCSRRTHSRRCPRRWLCLWIRTMFVAVFQRVQTCCFRRKIVCAAVVDPWNRSVHAMRPTRGFSLSSRRLSDPTTYSELTDQILSKESHVDVSTNVFFFHLWRLPLEHSTSKYCSTSWSVNISFVRGVSSLPGLRIRRLSRTLRVQELILFHIGKSYLLWIQRYVVNSSKNFSTCLSHLQIVSCHVRLEYIDTQCRVIL